MGAIVNGLDAARPARLRRDVPDLLRLHARRDPARGADGAAVDLRLHARLDRARRGRPDAPADRAARGAAGDAEPQRRSAPPTRNETALAWRFALRATETPDARSRSRARTLPILDPDAIPRRRDRARRLRAARRRRADARADPDRHRLGGLALRSTPPTSSRPTASPTRVVSMPCMEHFARAGRRRTATQVLPPSVHGARVAVEAASTVRLAPLDRRAGRVDRHASVRRLRRPQAASTSTSGSRPSASSSTATRAARAAERIETMSKRTAHRSTRAWPR